jgi:hypothetical protein
VNLIGGIMPGRTKFLTPLKLGIMGSNFLHKKKTNFKLFSPYIRRCVTYYTNNTLPVALENEQA